MSLPSEIIKYLIKNPPKTAEDLSVVKRLFAKKLKTSSPMTNSELLTELRKTQTDKNFPLTNFLRKRKVRTLSGIAAIAVLTKFHPCPGTCAYCPHEKNMPTSYLSNEPAVMRAILCKFNPYTQVQMRLRALQNNGHSTDKLELIVLGGTWSHYPAAYQFWFIKECFRAANDFSRHKKTISRDTPRHVSTKTLFNEQKRNETAKNRIIGLTLETRPDYINEKELKQMRALGATRVEIGVQHIDDKILKLNKRGHLTETSIKATELLRQFGFKITYHLMLNLPGSDARKDLAMFKKIYSDPRFSPDQIKIYPCVVAKSSLLYQWWQAGKWQPYSTHSLISLITKIKQITPPWVRIIRIIRDIPEESIVAGNKITNLRQEIKFIMDKQGLICRCIRCREAGHIKKSKVKSQKSKLFIRTYAVSCGIEYFISFDSPDQKILYAFCRLFLSNKKITDYLPRRQADGLRITDYAALLRELHTYGEMAQINQKGKIQHTGLGKKLLAEAEKITQKNHYQKISVISGIGVRGYYKKLGYKLENTYMVKNL